MSSIMQSAEELLGKIRTPLPQENVHAQVDPTSTERQAPMMGRHPGRIDSIAAAIAKNNPIVNLLRQSQEEDVYYAEEANWYENSTEDEVQSLLQGINPSEHWKVIGTLHPMQAQKVAADIRERDRLTQIQFANGNVVGLASEVASWLDPVSIGTGTAALSAGVMIPKAFRASKMIQRLGGGAALGAFAAGEEVASQYGRTESRDEEDILYAAAAGAGAGVLFGPAASAAFKSDFNHIARSADTRLKAVSREIQNDLDNARVQHPDRDTRAFSVGDERYNVRGGDIEVTDELKAAVKAKTLTQNFTPEEIQMATRADELVAQGAVGGLPDKSWVATMLEKNPFMTDGFRMLMSKSNAARVAATHFGELATGARGGVATSAAMHKVMHESMYLRMIPIIEQAQNKYLAARGIKQWNVMKYNGSGKKAFDEELVAEMGNRNALRPANPNVDAHIKRAADEIDLATKKALDDLKAAGWAGADEVKWKPGYFPLVWSGDKIQKLFTAGRGADVHELLKQAYTSVGMSPELASRLTSAVINRRLAGAAELDFNPAALFSKSSRGELERMLQEAGTSELDIRGIMKLTEGDAGGALKKRTEIDLNAEHNGLRVTDVINTDVGNLMSRWAQRTAGMVGLAKKGMTSLDEIDSYKKVIKSQAAGAGEDVEKLGKSVDALFDQLLARPVNGGVDKNMRRFLDWSMVTKLGQIGFAQIAELNNITAAHGVFQTLKSIPEAAKVHRQLVKAAKSGDYSVIDKNWFAEMQVLGGNMVDEHLLYRPSVRLDEGMSDGWAATFDNVMAMATDKLGYMSGMYQIKGVEQSMAIMLQTDKLTRALRGTLNKNKLARAREIGWSDEFIIKLKGEMDTHATFDRKVLDRLHLEKWDAQTRTEFLSGMHRHVHQMIQRPLAGESSYWMHSNIGAMMTQFRSFPLLAMEKQTGRHLLAGDAETGMAVMYGLGWATVAGMMKTYSNAIGRSDRDEYIQKRMTPEYLAMNALNYASTFSIMGDVVGAGASFTGLAQDGGARGSRVIIPPALSGLTQFARSGVSERGMRNFISAVPLGNTLPAAWITTGIANLLPEE